MTTAPVRRPRTIEEMLHAPKCAPRLDAYLDAIQGLLLEAQTEAIKAQDDARRASIERMLKELEDT